MTQTGAEPGPAAAGSMTAGPATGGPATRGPAAAGPGLMAGPPPFAPGSRVTLANWQDPPFNRWAFQHVRELIPTARISRGSGPPWRLPRCEPDCEPESNCENCEPYPPEDCVSLSSRPPRSERSLRSQSPP